MKNDQADQSHYPQDDEDSMQHKIDWIKRNPEKFQNFIMSLNSENSLKSKRQAQYDKLDGQLSYPEVVANPLPRSEGAIAFGNFLNFADPSSIAIGNNSKVLPVTNTPPVQTVTASVATTTTTPQNISNKTKEGECSRFLNSDNATAVLEKVLEELELIRKTKEGNSTPEGAACNIIGSWNSEVIGLRFDISAKNDTSNELNIKLNEHNPPKRVTLMNTNWTAGGYILKRQGGPFYLWTSKNKEETLATFTGICKNCGEVDTIFGTWSIVHPAKDCKDLQMAIETKRDIFRKETVHTRKQEKLSKIKKNSKTDGEFV
ncbi:hypothetical protein Bhyg_06259 [Pseudolycoriella hygida]|uniref:Uncharacterized protein n=1 Tax=Pseudolycoriella hygida TaxID=35572 RepID=A0A9Q0S288_9DIPT|nr:hypothetical protein Bhyg_06259 [Pseudolycoriella hygida]